MLFATRKLFLQGSSDGTGLKSPVLSEGTPQNSFILQTRWAKVLLALSRVAQLAMGWQPYFELSRLAQKQNASLQREFYL